jgi:hypothetical protein
MAMNRNYVIGIVALCIPLGAELLSPENGLGFDVLLYRPFSYAFILFVGVVFILANVTVEPRDSIFRPLATALALWLGWFIVTFTALIQLHLSLGGKL